jgi:DnaJ-class molecular chaperone
MFPFLMVSLPSFLAPFLQVCHGSGVEMKLRALGPGMVQQIQQRCSKCGGGGYSCPAADKCGQCGGKGLAPEKKVFEVRELPPASIAGLLACG